MADLVKIPLVNLAKLNIDEPLSRFWVSFKTWFQQELPGMKLLQGHYEGYNNWNNGTWYLDIDVEHEYRLHLGIPYSNVLEVDVPVIEDIKTFIELAYNEWLNKDKRYEFTVLLNKRFEKFKLPYRLQNGCLIKQGYKTTNRIDKIFNFTMFERKIQFSEEMISSNEFLDKKTALDYIVDALQYIVSVSQGTGAKEKYKSTAKAIKSDENSKIYFVVKSELEEVMKIANEFFDIRHNEYLNKAKETREAISDTMFIEYLYNRVYALLFLLRIKTDHTWLITSEQKPKEEQR